MRTGKYDVGTIHDTKHNGQLEVIEYIDQQHRRVRFPSTGFETVVTVGSIGEGHIKNPYQPSLFGVGYLGEPVNHPQHRVLYCRWKAMFNRVHNFKTGKTISPEWHCFATFLKDVIELEGFHLLQEHSKTNQIDLDCDILAKEKGIAPIYSRDTCKWVPHIVNIHAREYPKRVNIRPLGSVIDTKHGPVTIIGKDNNRWLIRFSDGTECWKWRVDVLRNTFAKPV